MPNLALFDFDGTITTNDNFTPFIHYAVDSERMVIGKLLLSPVFAAYKLGLLKASVLRSCIVAIGFRGKDEAHVRQLGLNYSRSELSKNVRAKALARIDWHKARGDTIVVVSASMDVYLADWCSQLGLDLICSELEARDGVLTGRYRQGDCSYERQAKRIRGKYDLAAYPIVYAYGDTKEDRNMLRLASKKYFRWQEI